MVTLAEDVDPGQKMVERNFPRQAILMRGFAIVSCSAVLFAGSVQAQTPAAFPGALGFGRLAVGGRGGAVFEVTSLADAGHGSLRACVEAGGPRTCIFRIGGTIELSTPMFASSYLTIAGQTTPGGGIALRVDPTSSRAGTPLIVRNAHDVILRHIRLRPGPSANRGGTDALTVEGSRRVIVDHVSMSWAPDENFNAHADNRDITVQWSILAEGLMPHSKGSLTCSQTTDCRRLTLHRNLYVSNNDRNPDIKSSPGGCVDFVNNVVHHANSAYMEIWGLYGGPRINVVANTFRRGPETNSNIYAIDWFDAGATGTPQIYHLGNAGDVPLISPETAPHVVGRPPCPLSVEHDGAAKAYGQVLAQAGAWPRDAVDARLASEVENRRGRLIDSPDQVGGWPTLAAGTPPMDADHDGMPDGWETANRLNPTNPGDRNGDLDRDGYTNLEEYLAQRAATVMR